MSVYLVRKGICHKCGYPQGTHRTDCPRVEQTRLRTDCPNEKRSIHMTGCSVKATGANGKSGSGPV